MHGMKKSATRRPQEHLRPKWMDALLDLPFVGVAIFDVETRRWVRFNDRICALLGYSRAELAAVRWTAVCHPADRVVMRNAFRRLNAARSGHVRIAQRLVRKDGHEVRAEVDFSLAPSKRAGGEFIVALVSDTRLPVAAAGAHAAVFDEGRTAMVLLDAETGAVLDANAAAQRLYGWTLQEIKRLGLHVWDVSRTDGAEVRRRLRRAAEGVLQRIEGTHRNAAGGLLEVEIHCGAVEIDGRRCVYGIVHDIGERKRAEAARRDAEEKLQAVVEQSITGIYIIEDGRFSYVNTRLAEIFGYARDEVAGLPVAELVAPRDRDRVAENVRQRLAGETRTVHYEFSGRRKDGSEVAIGAHGSVATLRGKRVIVGVLQDITERLRAERQSRDYVRKLESAMLATVTSMSRLFGLRDPYTAGHETRVSLLSAAIARELGVADERVKGIEIAGRVHDIGKISVPAEILAKPARLSPQEFELIKLHCGYGHEVLNVIEFPWPVAEITRQHHERLDGSGYPQGLRNGGILPEARIMAVADVIEAMSSHRPYRAALGTEPALAEIERGAGTLYDADVAAGALRLFRDRGYRIPA